MKSLQCHRPYALSVLACALVLITVFLFFDPGIAGEIKASDAVQTLGKTVEKAAALRREGRFNEAISAFDTALQIARHEDDREGELTCLMNLGFLRWDIALLKESNAIFKEAMSLSQRLNQSKMEARCAGLLTIFEYYSQGKEARSAGRYKESISHFETAIALARQHNSPEHELKCLRQLSVTFYDLEKYQDFRSFNEQGLALARKLNHRLEEGRCLQNIGLSFLLTQSYSKALCSFEEALEIVQQTSQGREDESASLNNIGLAYRGVGNYTKALEYLEKSLEIDIRLNDQDGISRVLNNMGIIAERRAENSEDGEKYKEALDFYVEALRIADKLKDSRSQIEILGNIGLLNFEMKKCGSSLDNLELALEKAEAIHYSRAMANILCNSGHVYVYLKEYTKGIARFKRALDLALREGSESVLWEAYFGLGQCLAAQEKYTPALACFRNSISVIERMRSRLSIDDYKAGFVRDKLKVYEATLDLLHTLWQQEPTPQSEQEIFDFVERAKARSFLENLSEIGNSVRESQNPKYKNKQKVLSEKISAILSSLIRSDLDAEKRDQVLAELEQAENECAQLMNRIKTETLKDIPLALPNPGSIKEIQARLLDDKTAILEYFLGEKDSFAFLLSCRGLVLKILPPRKEIENSLRAYLKMLSTPTKGKFRGASAAQRIYRELVSPFEVNFPATLSRLIVVPDGILYYLPFETLIKLGGTRNSEPRYLVELCEISYAPSVSSLLYLTRRGKPGGTGKSLLAVGHPVYGNRVGDKAKGKKMALNALRDVYLNSGFDLSPLPRTRDEVLEIARCFSKEKVDILLEDQAKEEAIKHAALERYEIIHFACHGFLDENVPMRSALVLTLDEDFEEDGFLQAREISGLKLNAELVVLSACQTGRGKLENAEGVLGLSRTLFYAGAKSIVSSLWRIDDKSTSIIMPRFYRYLTGGETKAGALRRAKLDLLKSKYSHPFYWATFVLNGDY